MAILDSNHKTSSDIDIVSAKGYDDDTDIDPTGEQTHFLPPNLSSDIAPKSTQRHVVIMCLHFLFIIEFSQIIMEPPLQEIMESFICRGQYSNHLAGVMDSRCKNPDVQQTLAMVRSWLMWVGMLVSLLVQIPYGIVADRYGRRPILFLGLLGVVLATSWNMIVLLQPQAFSIWHLLLAPIPTVIGGGLPVITAMVWTILSDAVPTAKRTSLFYKLHAMMLILSAAFRPVTGWLMSINPWLPMWLGVGALILSMLSTLLIPETLQLHRVEDAKRQDPEYSGPSQLNQGVLQTAWNTVKRDVSKTWSVGSRSKNVVLLVVGYGLCYPIMIAFEMNMLQYVTKRFDWDWSQATYFMTISRIASVVVLLVFLPLTSLLLTKRFGLDALTRDLYLSRGSILFVIAGNVFTALAATPWLLVASLIVLSFGNGFQPQLRAILAGVVEPHSLATLNTAIATVETLMGLFSVPALGWLLSKGIEIGGEAMGLPFVMTSCCSALAAVAIFLFRIPTGITHAEGGYELLSRPKR